MSESISSKANRWHKSLSQVTGGLSMRIVLQSLQREQIRQWTVILEAVLTEMKAIVEKS
jgi:hypothetical protein